VDTPPRRPARAAQPRPDVTALRFASRPRSAHGVLRPAPLPSRPPCGTSP